jgi:hypothetical protein
MAPNCFRSPCPISGMGIQNNKPGSERASRGGAACGSSQNDSRMRLERSLHCGIRPGCVYGLLASTMLYPLPKTKTFDVRQIMRSSSTMVRMRSRNFHSSRC